MILQNPQKPNPNSAASSVFQIMMFNHRSKYSYAQVPCLSRGSVLHTLNLRVTQLLREAH